MPYRPTERTRAKKADTRRRILDAARSLVARGGYAAAQVLAVASRAGVGTGTVYRYFPSKGALFAEVFRRASQREVDHVAAAAARPGTPRERLLGALRTFSQRALQGRRMAYALIAEPVDPAVDTERLVFRRAYARELEALIEQGVAAGACPRQDARTVAAFLVGGTAEALVGPLAPDAVDTSPDELIDDIIRAVDRAVFGGQAR